MMQLTLRGFDAVLERELRRVAKAERLSLNQAALKLLRKGAGLADQHLRPIGDALSSFVGTLSDDDARALELAIRSADEADLRAQRAKRK